ncbi:Proton channel OtopLc [Taenia solium]
MRHLIPCRVEHGLIAGAIFYKINQRIGHVQHKGHGSSGTSNRNPDNAEAHVLAQSQSRLLLPQATPVALVLFCIFQRRHSYQHELMLYQTDYIIFRNIGIIVAGIALHRIGVLSLRELSEADAFDDNLLLLGAVAVPFHDLSLLVLEVDATEERKETGEILEMAQALLQTFLILEAPHREVGEMERTISKPGRTIITFLLVLNLAMWIVNTFGLKHAENHEIFRLYYTGLAWKVITHLSLPLIIFFRFHSTVCLADI